MVILKFTRPALRYRFSCRTWILWTGSRISLHVVLHEICDRGFCQETL